MSAPSRFAPCVSCGTLTRARIVWAEEPAAFSPCCRKRTCRDDARPLVTASDARPPSDTGTKSCAHCHEPIKPTEYGDWIHKHGLYRCQSSGVAYGHLAHPSLVPCRADGPNPCLGAALAGQEQP